MGETERPPGGHTERRFRGRDASRADRASGARAEKIEPEHEQGRTRLIRHIPHPDSGRGRARERSERNEKNPKPKTKGKLDFETFGKPCTRHPCTAAPGAGSRLHECRDPLRRPSHRVERPPPSRLSVSHLTSRHSTTRHSPDSTGAHATRPIRTHDTNTHKTAHMTQTRTSCPRRFLQTPLLCTPQFRNSLRSSLLLT